jgi:6,7-dimethyl-8-ribityllumazine synthase
MATAAKNLSEYDIQGVQVRKGLHIVLVVSEWNEEITSGLQKGAEEVLNKHLIDSTIHIHHVPGSFELPMGAQWAFEHLDADGVICIGNVIRGETAHFDYVCQAASQGILNVGLSYARPCIFCVLTDDNIEQSRARSGGKHGNKGTEAAVGLIKMLALQDKMASGG